VSILFLLLSTYSDSRVALAKESRQHYTLNPIPGMAIAPPLLPTTPQPLPAQVPGSIGPVRKPRKARPHPTRVSKRAPVNTASPTNENVPQVRAPDVQPPQSNTPPANLMQTEPGEPVVVTTITQLNAPVVVTVPNKSDGPIMTTVRNDSDEPNTTTSPTGSGRPAVAAAPPGNTPPPVGEAPDNDTSDSISYTSTIPDFFDVGSDDTAPPATGPWMIIDHFTGEVICDDDQSIPPAPAIPTTPATPATPVLPGVEIAITPRLGTTYLVETPPTLLSEDEDVRPQWLMTAINSFFRFVPCVGSLGKVIDLYLAQEARLRYPELVRSFALYFYSSCSDLTPVHSPSAPIS